MTPTAITGGILIDGTGGEPLRDSTIVVRDGKIEAIGARGDIQIPKDADLIDANGKTVMPGMMDAHSHLVGAYWPDNITKLQGVSEATPELVALYAARHGLEMLRAGFTTVRDLGSFLPEDWGSNRVIQSLKKAIERGVIQGPRIVVAGDINMTAGHFDLSTPPWLISPEQTVDGPWAVRRRTRELIRSGVDLIKIAGSGGMAGRLEKPDWRNFTHEEMAAICDEAHALGKRVAAHVYTAPSIKKAIDSGVDTIEHGSPLDDECIALMKKKGLTLVPTLQVFCDKPPGWAEMVGAFMAGKIFAAAEDTVKSFQRAVKEGVKIALGTDITGFSPPSRQHGDNAFELELMVRYGMTPMQAIAAATKNSAEALDLRETGILQRGKAADLLVVNGDPLSNISVLRDKSKLEIVMKAGRKVASRGVLEPV
ncbi:MAG: amidohydrolase family protein [Thaumarchaeota archaeon]|nr:amidohydrolase family protein [Nitrososphaerota archaeon]